MAKKGEAAMDAVFKGVGHGSLAKRLLANHMNPSALRTNATLRKDEWKTFDEAVVESVTTRLVGVSDLISRGLVHNISNGLGTTVLEYEDQSDMEAAEMNMHGETRGANDRLEWDLNYLPLPITHKDFRLSIRTLEASRTLGQPLDTAMAGISARKVAERIETVLFTGASTYTFGGGTIYGYMDFTHRNTGSLGTNWDDSGADPLANCIAMKQASIDDGHYGPWIVYAPTNFDTSLDEDFSSSKGDLTVRQRIELVNGIEAIKVADKLTADNVIMAEMRPESARMVVGLEPTTIEWDIEGGMVFLFKVMAIMVPQLRADQADKAGIMHWS